MLFFNIKSYIDHWSKPHYTRNTGKQLETNLIIDHWSKPHYTRNTGQQLQTNLIMNHWSGRNHTTLETKANSLRQT